MEGLPLKKESSLLKSNLLVTQKRNDNSYVVQKGGKMIRFLVGLACVSIVFAAAISYADEYKDHKCLIGDSEVYLSKYSFFETPTYFKTYGSGVPVGNFDNNGNLRKTCAAILPFYSGLKDRFPTEYQSFSVETDLPCVEQKVFYGRNIFDNIFVYGNSYIFTNDTLNKNYSVIGNFVNEDYYNDLVDLLKKIGNDYIYIVDKPSIEIKYNKIHKIKYFYKGKWFATYEGTVKLTRGNAKLDNGDLTEFALSPSDGVFKTVCNEEFKYTDNGLEISKYSPEATSINKQEAAAYRNKTETDQKNNQKYLINFRKKVKIGTKVRVNSGRFDGQGLVINTKKDLVLVQFSERAVGLRWQHIVPFEQWIDRSQVIPPSN